jgi:hypothetical protein
MYSSKNVLGLYLVKYFQVKNGFFAFFKSISVGNWPFLHRFRTVRAAWKAYLTSMTPSTTTPGLGTPPANSRRTKQFWSHPHGLYLFLSVGPSDYGRGMT